jgi:hypothetical protein
MDSYKIYRHQFVSLVLLCSFGGGVKIISLVLLQPKKELGGY